MPPPTKSPLFLLRDGLFNLRRAFERVHALQPRENLTIQLGYDTGRAFELWFMIASSPSIPDARDLIKTTDEDVPWRSLQLDGVVIKWPLKRVPLLGGESIPEPLRHIPP